MDVVKVLIAGVVCVAIVTYATTPPPPPPRVSVVDSLNLGS